MPMEINEEISTFEKTNTNGSIIIKYYIYNVFVIGERIRPKKNALKWSRWQTAYYKF